MDDQVGLDPYFDFDYDQNWRYDILYQIFDFKVVALVFMGRVLFIAFILVLTLVLKRIGKLVDVSAKLDSH